MYESKKEITLPLVVKCKWGINTKGRKCKNFPETENCTLTMEYSLAFQDKETRKFILE
jgi:hypothetical protein